jgi:hypothetical protein
VTFSKISKYKKKLKKIFGEGDQKFNERKGLK